MLAATAVDRGIDFGRGSAGATARTLWAMTSGQAHAVPDGVAGWQRLLLPAALLEASDGRRTPRDWIVDALMYAFAIGLGVLILGSTAKYRSDFTMVLDAACGVVALVALWWRRQRPVEVAVVVIALSAFSALAAAAALAACFNAALRVDPRRLALITAFGLAAAALSAISYGNPHGYDWSGLVVGVLLTTVAVGWGLFARAQRDLVASLHERADRLEAERLLHEEQAREAERRRIAREMHDVLAHRISLLSVHAGALEFRPDAPPEEIAQAAAVVRGAAHAALQELRDVIGVLREGEEGDGADAARATDPPQPTLCDVPALVEESRRAGTRVALRLGVDDGDEVPSALGRTAYRIVQEGLTNARKHAPGAAVEVDVERSAEFLVVSVVSRRSVARVAVGAAGAGVGAGAGAGGLGATPPGAGTGLIGLGERVALAGGTLEHGPDAAGDFVLRARLPWKAVGA
jgi:signal transduction histidine kinase